MNKLQSDFLRNIVPAAIATQRMYGVPASITIAQAIAESGWGRDAIARKANNFFGIKAMAHTEPENYTEFLTPEYKNGLKVYELAKFAKYASPTDSFIAHARLLAQAYRYQPAMAVKGDPAKFAQAIKDCGYSTTPDYAARLMKLVAEFDLTQYDKPSNPAPAAPVKG